MFYAEKKQDYIFGGYKWYYGKIKIVSILTTKLKKDKIFYCHKLKFYTEKNQIVNIYQFSSNKKNEFKLKISKLNTNISYNLLIYGILENSTYKNLKGEIKNSLEIKLILNDFLKINPV